MNISFIFLQLKNLIRFFYRLYLGFFYGQYMLHKLINKYKKTDDNDEVEFVSFLKIHKNEAKYLYLKDVVPFIFLFGNDFVFNYFKKKYKISYFENMPYVMYKKHPIFMPQDMSEYSIIHYIRGIEIEQDKKSPHCYFPDLIDLKDKVLVDIGAAEGNFAIEYIDDIKSLYLFEADQKWIRPLSLTYRQWLGKVKIINSLIGDGSKNTLSLDYYFRNCNQIDLIKMDVEGAECDVIKGALNIISKFDLIVLLVCLYHYENQEVDVLDMLKEMDVRYRKGKMWFFTDKDSNISLRHGVAEFKKLKNTQ